MAAMSAPSGTAPTAAADRAAGPDANPTSAGDAATPLPGSVADTAALLATGDYVADRGLATAIHLALTLERPLLLEGEAGVGKTEIAKVLARTLGRQLIRLQCYEGLDLATAAYEWNHARQMVEIRLAEAEQRQLGPEQAAAVRAALERDLYAERFLIRRPLLQALAPHPGGPPVLLIDELDRTDEPFEAFLLELLSDFQLTIPELGTVRATARPIVIVTSNRTREIHDALKRRCFYHWIDYPDAERERAILARKVPQASARLSRQVVAFMQGLRARDLFKLPGVAETLDWTQALIALGKLELDPEAVDETLGMVLKYQDDIAAVRGQTAASLVEQATASGADPDDGASQPT
ncbi:MAG: MoxR family ATPase [Haliangiales bacterium]